MFTLTNYSIKLISEQIKKSDNFLEIIFCLGIFTGLLLGSLIVDTILLPFALIGLLFKSI